MVKCEYCGKNFKNLKLHQRKGKCGAAKAKKHREEREETDQAAKQEETVEEAWHRRMGEKPYGECGACGGLYDTDKHDTCPECNYDRVVPKEPHPDCIYNDPYADDPHRTPCLWCAHLRLKEKVEIILEHMCKMCKKRMEIP